MAASETSDIGANTRRAVRDLLVEKRILRRMVHDIPFLLGIDNIEADDGSDLFLWDEKATPVASGHSYKETEE